MFSRKYFHFKLELFSCSLHFNDLKEKTTIPVPVGTGICSSKGYKIVSNLLRRRFWSRERTFVRVLPNPWSSNGNNRWPNIGEYNFAHRQWENLRLKPSSLVLKGTVPIDYYRLSFLLEIQEWKKGRYSNLRNRLFMSSLISRSSAVNLSSST